MFKKIASIGVVCLLVVSILSAVQAEAKTTLKVWHYYGNDVGIRGLVERFNNMQSEIEVVAEFLPREELNKQFTIGVISGDLPDIGMVDNPDHAAFAAMGVYEDITALMQDWPDKDQYFKGPWFSTVYQGKNYGLPLGSNCLALFYNEEMLAAAGVQPPETWDQLLDAAAKLTKDGVYGLAISAPKNEEGTFQYLPWLLSSGATIEKLDSPEAIKSMAFLTELVQKGYMSKEVINWSQADAEKQFATGKAAMMVNGPWNIEPTKTDGGATLKFKIVKVPKDQIYSSVLGGENLGICKGANVKAAWEFLKFVGNPEQVEAFSIAQGYFPPRQDVAEQSAYWKSDPFLAAFAEQMQYAMPRGPHPKWADISNAISTALQESLTGMKAPDAAMKDAQQIVEKLLQAK